MADWRILGLLTLLFKNIPTSTLLLCHFLTLFDMQSPIMCPWNTHTRAFLILSGLLNWRGWVMKSPAIVVDGSALIHRRANELWMLASRPFIRRWCLQSGSVGVGFVRRLFLRIYGRCLKSWLDKNIFPILMTCLLRDITSVTKLGKHKTFAQHFFLESTHPIYEFHHCISAEVDSILTLVFATKCTPISIWERHHAIFSSSSGKAPRPDGVPL